MSEDNFIPIKLEFREGTLFRQLQDEIDVLKEQLRLSYAENKYILDQRDELQHKLDDVRDILQKMDNWCNAYPIDIFPEPDLIKARDVLEFARMSLDSISASAMRHVVNGMRDYVQEALKKLEEK